MERIRIVVDVLITCDAVTTEIVAKWLIKRDHAGRLYTTLQFVNRIWANKGKFIDLTYLYIGLMIEGDQ